MNLIFYCLVVVRHAGANPSCQSGERRGRTWIGLQSITGRHRHTQSTHSHVYEQFRVSNQPAWGTRENQHPHRKGEFATTPPCCRSDESKSYKSHFSCAHLVLRGSGGPLPCSFFTSSSLLRRKTSLSFPREPLRWRAPLPSCQHSHHKRQPLHSPSVFPGFSREKRFLKWWEYLWRSIQTRFTQQKK